MAFANLDGTPASFYRSGVVDPVSCEYAGDGVTITRIETTFLVALPPTFTQAGMKFPHATSGARTIERISGIFAVRDGTYQIELNRGWPEVPNFIAVRHPGDERSSVSAPMHINMSADELLILVAAAVAIFARLSGREATRDHIRPGPRH